MKRVLLLFGLLAMLTACVAEAPTDPSAPMPDDFNICYQSYYYAPNTTVLDTYEGYIQKDMVIDEPVRADYTATETEKQAIYDEIMRLHLTDIRLEMTASSFALPEDMVVCDPCADYDIRFTIDGKTYRLTGDDTAWAYTASEDEAERFVQFVQFMRSFMQETEEYQGLPEAEGGYC